MPSFLCLGSGRAYRDTFTSLKESICLLFSVSDLAPLRARSRKKGPQIRPGFTAILSRRSFPLEPAHLFPAPSRLKLHGISLTHCTSESSRDREKPEDDMAFHEGGQLLHSRHSVRT